MEGIRGLQHPLQTPVVLDCIFNNLKMSDLKSCRQVSRTWRHESGKAMRALATVKFHCTDTNPRGPQRFLELVTNDKSTFFQAPFVDTFTHWNGVADCPEFWETCGTRIKNLRLYGVFFSSANAFRQAIFQCCPNLENLEIIRVEVCGREAPESMEWVEPQFTPNRNLKSLVLLIDIIYPLNFGWMEILSNFPNLEKLEVKGNAESIFRALEVARQHDASSWKIKEVALNSGGITPVHLPPSFVRVFGGGDLALTSLSIGGIASNTEEDVTTVQKLLVTHAKSLRKLLITQTSDTLPEKDIFPLPGNQVLEKVQDLKLIGMKMRSTRFLEAFPNLKKLMLGVDEIPEDTETPHVTLDNCTELILENGIHEINDFKRLFGLLPNLKKLKIEHRLDNEGFSLICENWQDLTHLELDVLHLKVDDAGFSGYDQNDARKINKKGEKRFWRPSTVRRANLSSLKNLKYFLWTVHTNTYSELGYCTKACGILELPNLKYWHVKPACYNRIEDIRVTF